MEGLIDTKFKGKAAILDVPAIGIMDAALCFESAGLIKYGNKGNMTKQEIDFTCDKLIELKKAGHFRATWTTFDQSVQLTSADAPAVPVQPASLFGAVPSSSYRWCRQY
jgi:putative spermidine/putrescine transport system substrate-binding protein